MVPSPSKADGSVPASPSRPEGDGVVGPPLKADDGVRASPKKAEDNASLASGSAELRFGTTPERLTALWRKTHKEIGTAAPQMASPMKVMVHQHMLQTTGNILALKSVKELAELESEFNAAAEMAKAAYTLTNISCVGKFLTWVHGDMFSFRSTGVSDRNLYAAEFARAIMCQ